MTFLFHLQQALHPGVDFGRSRAHARNIGVRKKNVLGGTYSYTCTTSLLSVMHLLKETREHGENPQDHRENMRNLTLDLVEGEAWVIH